MNLIEPLIPGESDLQGFSSLEFQQCKRQLDQEQSKVLCSVYSQIAQSFLQPGTPVRALHSALAQLEPIAQRHGLLDAAHVSSLITQHQDIQQKINAARERTGRLQLIANVERHSAQFDAWLAADEFSKAANCIQNLLTFSRTEQGKLFPDLTRRCQEQKRSLQESLQELVDTAIQSEAPYQPQLILAPNWLTGAGNDPREVWRALKMLGGNKDVLLSLAQHLCQHVLDPLLKLHPERVALKIQAQQDDQGCPALDISFNPVDAQHPDSSSVEEGMLQHLQIVAEQVFGNDPELVHDLGVVLWPQLAQSYIQRCLASVQQANEQPDQAMLSQHLKSFQTAEQFEANASALLCLQPSSCGQIQEHVQSSIDNLMHAQQAQVMDQARQLFFNDDHETLTVGRDVTLTPRPSSKQANGRPAPATSDLAACGPFKVSIVAHTLVQLMSSTVQEALRSGSAAVVQSTCNGVLDVAGLFVAVPDPRLKQQLQQIPQLGCLHFTNCRYLAHELVALSYTVRQHSSAGLLRPADAPTEANNAVQSLSGKEVETQQFLDVAAELDSTAQFYLDQQVARQTQEVLELLQAAQGFKQVTNAQRGIAARKVVNQVLHSLQRLGDAFGSVLAAEDSARSAGQVLQAVLQAVIGDLMSMRDISVVESEDLPKILEPLVENGPQAALGRPSKMSNTPETERKQLLQTVKLAAPSIVKLQELLELMNARLVDFEDRWGSGRLQACNFGSTEVVHLIRALFEDTDMRRQVLRYVSST